ncbi:MAG TPA: sigma-54 dependent transcriptional regulator [Thiobacillaceae bacterium]|nr:sigma-54 dependent transcriptional regulator [Thiobacillaceae bacterium]HNU63856.1 sigma-54 dependent transcriptional regulator [Thiobacillaceae bacterium]
MSEILVVDDEAGIRELMQEILEEEGYEVRLAENGAAARNAMENKVPDLVLLDIWMPDVDGVSLLKEWKTQGRLTMPVVMMSGHGTVHTAVEATRLGAFDYLEKPIAYKQLLETVRKALDTRPSRPTTSGDLSALGMGEVIRRLTQRLNLAVTAGLPVALVGEAGSGAELAARYLTPPDGVFLLADVPATLANQPIEILAQAKGGLVFVPDLTILNAMQQRGLALLIGRRAEFGVRVVAASQTALPELLAAGQLSQELHDLLVHAMVEMPPLRARREDIPALASRMVEDACARLLIPPRRFTEEAQAALSAHDWPENLAELQALAGKLALAGGEAPIEAGEVRAILGTGRGSGHAGGIDLMLHLPLKDARDQFEKAYLEAMLAECNWGMSRAAERAGLDRTNLYRKVKQLGIEAPGKEK